MADQRFAAVVATALFSLCFDVAECDPYDSSHVESMICNGEHFEMYSPLDVASGSVLFNLQLHTPSSGFNYYTSFQDRDVTAYGHAACNGQLTVDACVQCLEAAVNILYFPCRYSVGAQIQLQDCRVRYENYAFTE